jgi:hypothetical protein
MGIGIPLLDTIGAIGSGLINKNAANKAQEAQERALTNARGDITQTYGEGRGYQQPYYDIGTQGLRNLSGMLGRGEFNGPAYNYQMGQAPNEQFNFEADPGYQWRLQQGANAINSGAAAAGNRLSGATMKALQRYGQNFAANEYQNAYNRYNTNRNFAQGQYEYGTSTGMQNAMNRYNAGNQQAQQRYNMYNTLANYGQAAGNNLSNLTTGYGQNLADLSIQRGNVQSAGIQGRANAYNRRSARAWPNVWRWWWWRGWWNGRINGIWRRIGWRWRCWGCRSCREWRKRCKFNAIFTFFTLGKRLT